MKRGYLHRTPGAAKKRLFGCLALFLIAMFLPVFLLVNRVYAQLDNEVFFNASRDAERLADRIDQALQSGLQKEQERPIAEYSFFNVLENPLLNASGLKFSPLSELPPKTDIAGLVGYFQIDADGSFHIPALPEIGKGSSAGLSSRELAKRLSLKEQLKALLSADDVGRSKTQAASPALKDEIGQVLNENRQQYILEKLPEPVAKDADKVESKTDAITGKQLQELNIDTGQWDKELKKNVYPEKKKRISSDYKTRKETVKLPEQSLSGTLLDHPKAQASAAPGLQIETERDTEIKSADSARESSLESAGVRNPVIFSFESEVGPLQMLALPSGHLCFYRQVWHNRSRFIQGFVVDAESFWRAAVQPFLTGTPYSSLLVVENGKLVQRFGEQSGQPPETLLYRGALLPPFQSVELIVNAAGLEIGPAKRVIDLLALSLACILSGGVAIFYRLGSKQIELSRQQQNFISAVSHELKTPLTSIRMYGEMLRSGWVSDETRKQTYYDYIFFESERLSRLIANVLQLARIENGHVKSESGSLAPELLLRRVKEKIAAQIEASGFVLHSDIPEEMKGRAVIVEEDAFYQIVINLIDNAVKFASAASNKTVDIGFKTGKRRNEVIFFVRDYGSGIKKDQIRKIFKLFYRSGDEMIRATPGTGIGLALARQLAETMSAKLTAVNTQPGAEFQIILKLG